MYRRRRKKTFLGNASIYGVAVLGWPKSLFGCFHTLLQKNSNKFLAKPPIESAISEENKRNQKRVDGQDNTCQGTQSRRMFKGRGIKSEMQR